MCRCQLGGNQERVKDDLPGTNNHRLRGLGPREESEWGKDSYSRCGCSRKSQQEPDDCSGLKIIVKTWEGVVILRGWEATRRFKERDDMSKCAS